MSCPIVTHGTGCTTDMDSLRQTASCAYLVLFALVGCNSGLNNYFLETIGEYADVHTVKVVSNEHDYLSPQASAYQTSNLTWTSNRSGLSYQVKIDGSDCGAGTLSGGSNASGTTSGGNLISMIRAVDMTDGVHTVRLCVANNDGSISSATHSVTRDSVGAAFSASIALNAVNISPDANQIILTSDKALIGAPTFSGTEDCRVEGSCGANSDPLAGIGSVGSWNPSTRELTITLKQSTKALPEFTLIRLPIAANGATDLAGNPIASFSWTFRTGAGQSSLAKVDTGQTSCFRDNGSWVIDTGCNAVTYTVGSSTAPQGQDAHVLSPAARSYTPQNHASLTADGTNPDSIVNDNNTGLIWKRCTQGQSSICGSSATNFSTWYNAIQSCHDLNTVNSGNGYYGRTDWRLPTVRELLSIVDFGAGDASANPRIDAAIFPNTAFAAYWTYTTSPTMPTAALVIDFRMGETYVTNLKTGGSARRARCVAGSTGTWTTHSFADNGDGTITDNGNSLTWRKCMPGQSGTTCGGGSATLMSLVNAMSTCESMGGGWRLPTPIELEGLTMSTGTFPGTGLDLIFFPSSSNDIWYWTSTTYLPITGDSDLTFSQSFAYNITSRELDGDDRHKVSTTAYVRCVR